MAERVILFLDSEGIASEIDTTADSITTSQYTVNGGPVLGSNLDMNNGNISDADSLAFTDPTSDGIAITGGTLIADNIMGETLENSMVEGAAILFPAISDVADSVDALQVPQTASAPTASPNDNTNQGFLVASGGTLYMWDGSAWNDLGIADDANGVVNSYTATAALAEGDAVYIDGADSVNLASAASSGAASRLMGFADAAISAAASGNIKSEGLVGGQTGLTAGARLYLSTVGTTGNTLTETKPSGAGNVIVQAGYVKNSTTFHAHIEQLGRLA
jgi:hypothetical protein